MKTASFLFVLLFALSANAGITLIDQTTLTTNANVSSGNIWMTGLATNKPYTITNSVISKGDSPSNAWAKANANFTYLDTNETAHLNWISNNAALINAPVPALVTNLYPGMSNYVGTVSNFYSYTLTQITNYTPLSLWYETATLTGTNYNPAHAFDWGATYWVQVTNTTLPTNAIWLTMACSNTICISGQPAGLTINSVQVYTNYTTSPTIIGIYNGTTNFVFNQTTNFSAVDLWASYENTNYWQVYDSLETTNQLYLALIARTNNPAPGGFASLTVNALNHPERNGTTYHFINEDFQVHNLQVDGALTGNGTTQIVANASAIAALQSSFTNFYRAGSVFVASSATSTNIIFSRPFAPSVSTNYSISFGSGNSFATFPNPEWSAKTTNGFTLNVSAVVGGGWQDWSATVKQ